jgi:hypothetical protein
MRTQSLQLARRYSPEPNDDTAACETDAELARAILAGDLDAAARLYDRYASNVRGMVHHLLGPDGELDDVVQDVFVTAIASIEKLREPALLKSWLLGIAVGKAKGHLRTRWRRRWGRLPRVLRLDRAGHVHRASLFRIHRRRLSTARLVRASADVQRGHGLLRIYPSGLLAGTACRWRCGNDVCDSAENSCNCPEDCGAP